MTAIKNARPKKKTTAATFPVLILDHVWHVGSLENAPKNARSSYEGHHLSVSWCPDAWTQIARIGGNPTWFLTKTNTGQFLDVLELRKKQRTAIINWGIQNKFVAYEDRWQVISGHDEDTEEDQLMICSSLEEAIDNSEDDEEYPPQKITHLIATSKLLHHVGCTTYHTDNGWGLLPMAWAEAVGLDGVWWCETYDPDRLSAPRGCIFQSRLNEWSQTQITGEENDDQLSGFPKAHKIQIEHKPKNRRPLRVLS